MNLTQGRACTDLSGCNTTNDKPNETQSCQVEIPKTFSYTILLVIIALFLGAGVFFYWMYRRSNGKGYLVSQQEKSSEINKKL